MLLMLCSMQSDWSGALSALHVGHINDLYEGSSPRDSSFARALKKELLKCLKTYLKDSAQVVSGGELFLSVFAGFLRSVWVVAAY